MVLLYRDFTTQAQIDAQYDVDLSVSDYGVFAEHYVEQSRATRRQLHGELDVAYGPTRDETLDIFPAAHAGATVFVFLHGGYWRSLSSKEFSCVARGPHALGLTTVIVNYSLTPKVSLDEIVRQVRAAVAWVVRHIEDHGGNPRCVVIGGHSAGAQLAAMCLQTAWDEDYGLPIDPLAGAILISGVYDLSPLRFSTMQPQLQLDEGAVRRNSPLFGIRACRTPILITWGSEETDEFHRQSETYFQAWSACGNRAERGPQGGRNHFDVVYGLEDPANPLSRWIASR